MIRMLGTLMLIIFSMGLQATVTPSTKGDTSKKAPHQKLNPSDESEVAHRWLQKVKDDYAHRKIK